MLTDCLKLLCKKRCALNVDFSVGQNIDRIMGYESQSWQLVSIEILRQLEVEKKSAL